MRRILWLIPVVWIVVILLCLDANAQPYVVCDEYTTTMVQPEYFNVVLDGMASRETPETMANGSKRLHMNVGSVSVATHSMTVAACITDSWTGAEVCSDTVPFEFTRPAVPMVTRPSGIGLVK